MPKLGIMLEKIKRYKKLIMPIIIVGLVIALSVTQCQKQKLKHLDLTSQYQSAINIEKARVVVLSNQAERLKADLYEQREKDSLSQISSNKEIRYWRGKAKATRVIVETVIKENPQLEEFVSAQDSLISKMDVFIDTLQDQKADQWRDFNTLLAITDQKFQASGEINKHLESINKDLHKRVRRERSKKTFYKIAAGVLGGALIGKSVGVF